MSRRSACWNNPEAELRLYGQGINDQSYAICKSDMIAKGQDPGNIRLGDTLTDDHFWDRTFDYAMSSPPFGYDWKGSREAIEKEALIPGSRFSHGLPSVGDGAMLFLCHVAHKMHAHEGGGRAGIVLQRLPAVQRRRRIGAVPHPPVAAGVRPGGGDHRAAHQHVLQHRHRHLHLDPGQHQTPRAARQDPADRRLVVLDEAAQKPRLEGSGGRRRLRDRILALYDAFDDADPEVSKVFTANDFGYWTITVERPLLDDAGNPVTDRKGVPKPDTKRRDTENVPFTYNGNTAGGAGRETTIKAYFEAEVARPRRLGG